MVEGIGDGSLKLDDILDFVDSGHDLILAANVNASNFIRNVASDCGADFVEVRIYHKHFFTLTALASILSVILFVQFLVFC